MRLALIAVAALLVAGCTSRPPDEDDPVVRYNGLAFEEDVCGPPVNATAYLFAPGPEAPADIRVAVSVDGETASARLDVLAPNSARSIVLRFEGLDLCASAGRREVDVRVSVGDEVIVDKSTTVAAPRARALITDVRPTSDACNETVPLVVRVLNDAVHAAPRVHVIVDSAFGTWDTFVADVASDARIHVEAPAHVEPSCTEGDATAMCFSAKADNGPIAIYGAALQRADGQWRMVGLHAVEPCYSWEHQD